MSQKNIAAVLFAIVAALGGPVAVEHVADVNEQVASSVAVSGPEKAVVGELVELTVSGSRPSWLIPVDDHRVDEHTALVSFRKNGRYEVVVSAITAGQTSIVRHSIVVGPEAEPTPAPDPGPRPEPTPEPMPDASTLSDDVYEWCLEAKAPKAAAREIGDNFIDAATEANDIDDLLQRVAAANRSTNQKGIAPVLSRIQSYLFENLQGESFEAHRCAFDAIGQGFIRYSEKSNGP